LEIGLRLGTRSQTPAFAEAALRRQAKFQTNSNVKILILKQDCFGHLELKFGTYLGFEVCDLAFETEKRSIGEKNAIRASVPRDSA